MTFGIIAMVLVGCSWTLCGYVMGKAPKKNINVSSLLLLGALIAFLFSLSCGILTVSKLPSARGVLSCFAVLTLCGLANYFQLTLMSKAMQRGPNGIVWSITQAGFVWPFFMGIVFFGVHLSWAMMLGFASVIVSLILFGLTKNETGKGKWKLLVFSAFLVTGISQSLSNLPSYFSEMNQVSSAFRTAFWSLGLMIGAVVGNVKNFGNFWGELKNSAKSFEVWKYACILQLFELICSLLLLYRGMDSLSRAGAGAIAYPLMVCSCLICFEVIALLILREKRTLLQIIALILCMLGVVALCN
ncbi:MAG: hypothetical protein IJW31_00820 [Lentisphaeria bacterium]|nr:hypothetical protein [Lentisphaeria bacterium]